MKETNKRNIITRGINFLKRKSKVLHSKLIVSRYRFLKIKNGVNDAKRDHQIIVSLTSYPKRLDDIYLTIKSLMDQDMKADKIILYLGCDSKDFKLNKQLLSLKEVGLEIVYLDEDIKSHKKYFYVMQEYPDALIITADDDLIYDKKFISGLYNSYLSNPDVIHAYRVHKYKFEDKKIASYAYWDFEYEGIYEPSRELFLTTGAGVLFPPSILPKECFDKENIIKLCPFADDVWINFFIIKSGLRILLVKSKRQMPIENFDVQITNLNTDNVDNGGNDKYLNQLINHYNIDLYEYIYSKELGGN